MKHWILEQSLDGVASLKGIVEAFGNKAVTQAFQAQLIVFHDWRRDHDTLIKLMDRHNPNVKTR